MTPKTRLKLATINLILSSLILIDYFLLGEIMPVQKIDSFYNTTVKVGRGRKPTYEDRKILLLENGETYRVGKLPNQDYEKGQEIRIVVSALSRNVNEIIVSSGENEKEEVGIFAIWYFKLLIFFALIVSLVNFRNYSRVWGILLVAATMFLFIFSPIYFFWF